jgi:hypothetical protein
MIAIVIQNMLPVNVREAIMNFCFFFNAIGQKVLSEEALESSEKRHYETLCLLEMYFPPAFFDVSVHFTTHLIKEIKLLGPVFLHQMYAYERFNDVLKSFVRNRAYPEGSMVQGYCTEEALSGPQIMLTQKTRLVYPNLAMREGSLAKGPLGRRL